MTNNRWLSWLIIITTLLAGLALAAILFWLLSHIMGTLTVLLLGWVIAFILKPIVEVAEFRLGHRALAIFVVLAVFLLLVVLGLTWLFGPLVRQLVELANAIPKYVQQIQAAAPYWQESLARLGIALDLSRSPAEWLTPLQQGLPAVLSRSFAFASDLGAWVTNVVLGFVIALYLLADGERLGQRSLALLPPKTRKTVKELAKRAGRVFAAYLRGQLALAVLIGVVTGLGSWMIGVPYAAVIGLLAGIFELVPMIGSVLGAIPAILIALFQPFPTVIFVLIFFVVVQQLEGNFLVPRITGRAVGLGPLTTLIVLIAGFEIAGLPGAIFAVPFGAVVYSIVRGYLAQAYGEETSNVKRLKR